jgi:hypothetical protein
LRSFEISCPKCSRGFARIEPHLRCPPRRGLCRGKRRSIDLLSGPGRIKPEDTPAFIEEGLEVFRLFTSPRPRRRQLAPLRGIQPHPAIQHCFARPELRV